MNNDDDISVSWDHSPCLETVNQTRNLVRATESRLRRLESKRPEWLPVPPYTRHFDGDLDYRASFGPGTHQGWHKAYGIYRHKLLFILGPEQFATIRIGDMRQTHEENEEDARPVISLEYRK